MDDSHQDRGHLWFDMTFLDQATNKRVSGIPRTVICVAQRLVSGCYGDVRFCAVDATTQRFREVDAFPILGRFTGEEIPVAAPPEAPPVEPVLKRRARRAIRYALGFLPDFLRTRVVRVGRTTLRAGRWGKKKGTSAARRLRNKVSPPAPQPPAPLPAPLPPHPLRTGDTLLNLGTGWDTPPYSAALWQLKQDVGCRIVSMSYDIIPIPFPQFFGAAPEFTRRFEHWLVNFLWTADVILSISHHTKRDLLRYCDEHNIPAPPIDVVRLGENLPDHARELTPPQHTRFRPNHPFALTVSTVEARKNHHALYHAWRRLTHERGDQTPQLVIVGQLGWLTQDLVYQIEHDPVTAGSIVLLNHVADHELAWLYQNCLFTLYPSHYEGWGLPIAESLNYGKYCIASSTSSMPEVGGDLVSYHDPDDVPALHRLVCEALEPGALAEREAAIRERFQPTTWDHSTQQILDHVRQYQGLPVTTAEPAPTFRRSA